MTEQWLPPKAPPPERGHEPEPLRAEPPHVDGLPPYPAERDVPHKQEHWLRRLFGPLLLFGFAVFKWGKLVVLAVAKGKFFVTGLSMIVSIGAYTLFWGLPFAVGIVGLLLIHECGHALQMKREGIKVGGMAFIPFLGAAVWSKELERDALAEARVGLAGPIIGSLAAAACLIPHAVTGNDFWLALAYFGFFINLINLVPVTPFDGGRAMAAMAPWMWFVGLFIMAGFLFWRPNPFVMLFLVLGALDVYRRWKERKAGGEHVRAYYAVKPRNRILVGVVYVSLAVALVAGMNAAYIDPDRL